MANILTRLFFGVVAKRRTRYRGVIGSPLVNHESHHVTVLSQNCSHYATLQANSAYHTSGVGK